MALKDKDTKKIAEQQKHILPPLSLLYKGRDARAEQCLEKSAGGLYHRDLVPREVEGTQSTPLRYKALLCSHEHK